MSHILNAIDRFGGVARVAALRGAGVSSSSIRRAVLTGTLVRVRKGWVRTPNAPEEMVRAVSLGGRVACISAAQFHGLWTPDHGELHLGRPSHAGHTFGEDSGTISHWQSDKWETNDKAVDSVPVLVRQVLLCCTREEAITIIDSALNLRKLSMKRLREIVSTLPSSFASVLDEVDGRAESGLESLCRVRLSKLRVAIRTQVRIEGVGRVDLILGDRLVIESDGQHWHEGTQAFERDRTRDLILHRLGYIVIRVSYWHVVEQWMLIELAVKAIVDRREHLWSSAHKREFVGAR